MKIKKILTKGAHLQLYRRKYYDLAIWRLRN